ncbi:MAG: ABC transporter ATP-binding protein [Anaerolineae bacterium]|nr:ABC transporter ATP-binding protein [Anaerolineae bacterium]
MGWMMDGLESDRYDRTYGDLNLVRRVLSYFRPHWKAMAVVVLAIVCDSAVSAGTPILISWGIDLVAGQMSSTTIALLVGTVLVFSAMAWVFNYFRWSISARVVGDVVLKLRQDAFAAVTQRDLSFYDEEPSGKIVSRVTSDTQDFSEVVMLVLNLVSQLLMVAVLFAVLATINLRLTLALIVLVPVVVGLALSFRRVARTVTQKARRVLAKVNALIQESISGIAVAKNFRQEAAVYKDFQQLNQQAYRVNLIRGWTLNTIIPLLEITVGLGTALIVYYGGIVSLQGLLTPGQWYLFVQAMYHFWGPLTSIASFWSQFQDGLSAAERVFALIDAEPKVVQVASEPVGRLQGRVEFRHVHFTYTGREVVLDDFSLEIRPGETVAIVGHTGAGKSSLARLVARFYEFQGGQILIDGRDIRTFDLAEYRRQLGIVPQEPFLFSGTVMDNIRYSRPESTDDEVRAAARKIAGGEWVELLPNGLQTDVGERGGRLSMGQRQLVALARVVLADPRILILDEATASVDPFTEAQIQEGLEVVMQGRTSIVIAHRLSTVENADRIIVLRNGRIIEEGTHRSLLAAGGHYAELYNTYFRHQSLEYIEQARLLAAQA